MKAHHTSVSADDSHHACPLCGSVGYDAVYDLRVRNSADDVPGIVVRCRTCAMWFKVLTNTTGIAAAYPGEYGHDEIAATYLSSPAARTFFQHVLDNLRTCPDGTRPRLLDIGAAQGTFLEEARRRGFDCHGIDHCEPNVADACAKGLHVTQTAAEDLDCEDSFDVVTMLDIIEHLPDPMRVLRAAQRALKPGGELVVYTPNHRAAVVVLAKMLYALGIRYPVQEIFGRNHVCFFDHRSLPRALATTGFTVRLLQQFPYDVSRPGQPVSRANLAAIALVEGLGQPLRRLFRMLVYAQKPRGTNRALARPVSLAAAEHAQWPPSS